MTELRIGKVKEAIPDGTAFRTEDEIQALAQLILEQYSQPLDQHPTHFHWVTPELKSTEHLLNA